MGKLAWKVLVPAKVNLSLKIYPKDFSGYHPLLSLMAMVSLYDEILYKPSGSFRVEVTGRNIVGEPTSVIRAAEILASLSNQRLEGSLLLKKRIPDQAGFGGGSGDAAATLMLLCKAWRLHYQRKDLMQLGRHIGSDVPFFFTPTGAAIVSGCGEVVEPVTLKHLVMVLAKGNDGMETKTAFQMWDNEPITVVADPAQLVQALNEKNWLLAKKLAVNAFQKLIASEKKEVAQLLTVLEKKGARVAVMSGSGTGVLGIFSSISDARRCAAELRSCGWWTKVVWTRKRGLLVQKLELR
ncbi:MAG: 4-(cytidine 5'-diphospho)-2-C-methyl-D-erythritol kinase [Armatimonadetes bacterium]|nr:4-(cytidine 5'-diphospho)-2-C-methyl-D-erythritol kinase [Armatimonadota bacterium]MDW8121413.1 4-(cytidine 5'-diphospho)-2-C-methyl-D-erythritol kinase [Armatimonadota bacterium]